MTPTQATEAVERSRLEPEPMPRRDFLGLSAAWTSGLTLLFAALGLAKLVKPGVLPSPSKKFRVTLPESLALGEPFIAPGRPVCWNAATTRGTTIVERSNPPALLRRALRRSALRLPASPRRSGRLLHRRAPPRPRRPLGRLRLRPRRRRRPLRPGRRRSRGRTTGRRRTRRKTRRRPRRPPGPARSPTRTPTRSRSRWTDSRIRGYTLGHMSPWITALLLVSAGGFFAFTMLRRLAPLWAFPEGRPARPARGTIPRAAPVRLRPVAPAHARRGVAGVVTARVWGERGALRIAVRDRGPGIPAGEERAIFEPFRTSKTRGTGLGLAVARRVVELHGGEIRAARGDDGGGAVIDVTVPR